MSREDPIIVKIDKRSVRMVRGSDAKRACRDADIVISDDNAVIKDRFGPGLGQRRATADERRKATPVHSQS